MPCCGDKRLRLLRPGSTSNVESARPESAQPGAPRVYSETARVQYTGRTGMTVIGPFTRYRYRFNHPEEVLEVDKRDAPSLAAVPHLKWLR